jgi:quinol monooxygenase YgiN
LTGYACIGNFWKHPLTGDDAIDVAAFDSINSFWRRMMPVYNVVKFKVKAGEEAAFLAAHSDGKAKWPGLERGVMIKTGEQTFCLIGEWSSQDAMVAARPAMIKTLDSFRAVLEDQGGGRGMTDAVSGAVVLDL